MIRLGILNMLIGFTVIFLAACAGSFIAFDTTQAFLRDPELLAGWQLMILRSAHGHSNLFGLTHIALGLTMPWSTLPQKTKCLQTIGLSLGTLAMSVLMVFKAYQAPTDGYDFLGVLIGGFLSAALWALGLQVYGLADKLYRDRG